MLRPGGMKFDLLEIFVFATTFFILGALLCGL